MSKFNMEPNTKNLVQSIAEALYLVGLKFFMGGKIGKIQNVQFAKYSRGWPSGAML